MALLILQRYSNMVRSSYRKAGKTVAVRKIPLSSFTKWKFPEKQFVAKTGACPRLQISNAVVPVVENISDTFLTGLKNQHSA